MDLQQAFHERGLTLQASPTEAKAAYRALAMRWHPDLHAGQQTDSHMQRINVAYALVCQYQDARLLAAARSASQSPSSGFKAFDWKTGFQCAPSPGRAAPQTTTNERKLHVSLLEAAFGCIQRISGKTECQAWQVDVAIHAGTLDGMLVAASDIRVRQGPASLPQHLRLTVQIAKHPIFNLVHNRLSVTVPISVWRWALGGELTLPTLDGSVRVTLPTTPGALLVKHQGWPEYQSSERRPLFVLPKLIYPEQLRIEERRMLELLEVRSCMPEVQAWSRHMQARQGASSEPG